VLVRQLQNRIIAWDPPLFRRRPPPSNNPPCTVFALDIKDQDSQHQRNLYLRDDSSETCSSENDLRRPHSCTMWGIWRPTPGHRPPQLWAPAIMFPPYSYSRYQVVVAKPVTTIGCRNLDVGRNHKATTSCSGGAGEAAAAAASLRAPSL